jgi:hypothetical protein
MKKVLTLKIIAIYQIIVWLLCFVILIKNLFYSFFINVNFYLGIILLVFIFIDVALIYTNVCLLFNFVQKKYQLFLKINLWSNFFQIFHFSLFGFAYYMAFGVYFLFYYSYDETQKLLIGFDYFRCSFGINYSQSDLLLFGIDIVPLLIFLFFNRKIKSIKVNAQNFS